MSKNLLKTGFDVDHHIYTLLTYLLTYLLIYYAPHDDDNER